MPKSSMYRTDAYGEISKYAAGEYTVELHEIIYDKDGKDTGASKRVDMIRFTVKDSQDELVVKQLSNKVEALYSSMFEVKYGDTPIDIDTDPYFGYTSKDGTNGLYIDCFEYVIVTGFGYYTVITKVGKTLTK